MHGNWRQCARHGLTVAALWAMTATATAVDPGRGLIHAVDELSGASHARQVRFVDAAIGELTAAYRQLSAQAGDGQAGWATSTRAFSARLGAAAAAARAGAAIRILAEADGSLRVVVGSRPARQFMITAPAAGSGVALERAILERFCRADGCGRTPQVAGTARAATRQPESPVLAGRLSGTAAPGMVLSEVPGATRARQRVSIPQLVEALPGGDDGLRCRAGGAVHARLQASACAQLEREIRALALAVHAAARRGIAIEWPLLAMPPRIGMADKLLFNARGDHVALALPALACAPELRAQLVPWLQDRLVGSMRELTFEPPSRLVYAAR